MGFGRSQPLEVCVFSLSCFSIRMLVHSEGQPSFRKGDGEVAYRQCFVGVGRLVAARTTTAAATYAFFLI